MSNTYWVTWESERFTRQNPTEPWTSQGCEKGANAMIVKNHETPSDVLGRRGISSKSGELSKRVVTVVNASRLP